MRPLRHGFVAHTCEQMPAKNSVEKYEIGVADHSDYDGQWRMYSIKSIGRDRGNLFPHAVIRFCPWCGKEL